MTQGARARAGHYLLGLLLIVFGALLLAQNIGVASVVWGQVWALASIIAGFAAFIYAATGRERWWAAIPGGTALGIGIVLGLPELDVAPKGDITSAIVLGGIAVGFWFVFMSNRAQWWSIIPAGVMTTLSVMPILEDRIHDDLVGSVFFLGLGATFLLLSILPPARYRQRWAAYPALACAGSGVIIGASALGIAGSFWGAVFIVSGGYLLVRNLARRRATAGVSSNGREE